jgi:hypothetical protein
MEVVLNEPSLAPYQRAIIDSPARITITEACTKSGKSFSHSWWNFREAHRPIGEGAECLWVAPSHGQAKMIFEEVARIVAPLGKYGVNRSEQAITTPNGGILRYVTGEKPDLLYGRSNVQQIVVDEYTRCRPEVFDVCMSILTATGGKMKLIGNYIGNANWGHILKERMAGDPMFDCFTITATDAVRAGIMRQDRVDLARKTLHPAVFAALYMCEGSAHPLQMMQADAINDLWTNPATDGEPYIVVDVARFGRDRTIVGIWRGLTLVDIVDYTQQDLVTTAASIDNLARLHKVGRSRIAIDEGGVGGGVVDILSGCMPFNGAAKAIDVSGKPQNFTNLRSQAYFTLADHVNDRSISIDPELSAYRVDLSMELEAIRRHEDMAEGKLRVIPKDEIKEALGRSPDLADMLMMRMLFELKGGSVSVDFAMRKGKQFRREAERRVIRNYFRNRWER